MHPLTNRPNNERAAVDRGPALHLAGGRPPIGRAAAVEQDPLYLLSRLAERRVPLRDVQDQYIDHVLALVSGNKVRAARILGIDRKTLYRRAARRARRNAES